ncbi:hypothetical protein C8R44DRAFT_859745 [Mycena epipterygia]|nr:hypothetical protein C8R44DRAFT_859745 [Mycena epipterygia]
MGPPSCRHLWGSVGPTSARCGAEWSSNYIRDGQWAQADILTLWLTPSKPQTLSASPASGGPEVDTVRWTLVDETEHHLLLTSIPNNSMTATTMARSATTAWSSTTTRVPFHVSRSVVVLAPVTGATELREKQFLIERKKQSVKQRR